MTLRLLFIRHGKPDYRSRNFLATPRGRQWDPPLDPEGRDQAQRLAERLLLVEGPIASFVSPFRRCRETIEPYLRASGSTAGQIDDLGEVFIGEWEGMSFEEIVSGDEELARRFREQEPMFGLAPGGESGERLRRRVVASVERLIEDVPDGTLVVVTHGGVINAYLGHVMAIPQDMFFLPDNTSINTVEVEGARRQMRFLNDIRHLTEPALFAPPAGTAPGSR